VATVIVSPSSATLVPQQGTLLTATLRDASGNTLTGRTIQWTSTATAVASVDATGAVTALSQGSATIIATSEGQSGNAAITVNHGGFVGPTGGQATGFSGNVTLIVPAGALASNTAITITQIANPTFDPKLIPGTAFDLGPNGTQFAQPVTIRIKYNSALVSAGANPSQFRLARLTGATWVPVPGSSVDILTQTVTGQTSSFSSYAIIEVLPPVAAVTLTGSLRVKVGDAYTYTATARLADGTIVVRPVTWGILETAKATIDPNGVLVPIQAGTITILATIDGVVWQGFTTAYDWDVIGGGTSIFLSLLADNQITNQFGTSEYAELVIGCSAGSFQIWVDTDHFVTASGLVAYSFDGGTVFTQTWIEFDGFSALGYPGSTNLLRKSFAQLMATARLFALAFNEFHGTAKAMGFRLTGLPGILPPVLAACPGNNVIASDTQARAELAELRSRRGPSRFAPEAMVRAELGPEHRAAPDPGLLRFLRLPEVQEAVRRP
jgi:uncharacterized protein YjdB